MCTARTSESLMIRTKRAPKLGDVFHPLTGSNQALPSTAVRWRVGFACRITRKRIGKEARGTMKRRGLELGERRRESNQTTDRRCFQDTDRADDVDSTPCRFLTAIVVIN